MHARISSPRWSAIHQGTPWENAYTSNIRKSSKGCNTTVQNILHTKGQDPHIFIITCNAAKKGSFESTTGTALVLWAAVLCCIASAEERDDEIPEAWLNYDCTPYVGEAWRNGLQNLAAEITLKENIALAKVQHGDTQLYMAGPAQMTAGLPLDAYSKYVAPGWIPGNPAYPFKAYVGKLKSRITIHPADEADRRGALITGRLKGLAYKHAMRMRIIRGGVAHVGPDAIILPPAPPVLNTAGEVVDAAQKYGLRQLMGTLKG